MRVCQPRPVARNCATTSGDRRMVMRSLVTSAGGRPIASDADFVTALLDEHEVAVVHGAAFGLSPHIRISYAASDADLAEAMTRIRAFCDGLT